uniref:Uncharacterized protein n=1 Tax=Pyxicephalus adspersus TaxID=30357 RepID=A0AAV2ZZ79_PYXAD|nr:TPA: hypothetical protein GDO54_017410 [Pyxicephalus adspersus]
MFIQGITACTLQILPQEGYDSGHDGSLELFSVRSQFTMSDSCYSHLHQQTSAVSWCHCLALNRHTWSDSGYSQKEANTVLVSTKCTELNEF